jgi:hypothetical protein
MITIEVPSAVRAAVLITGYDGAVTQRAGDGAVAGPQDRVTDEQPTSDAARPREHDPVKAQLQERMERLPPGHPSSPYNDDGSRKPPVPDPFKNDYPIPGDPDYQADAPSSAETGPTSSSADNINDPSSAPDRSPDQELPAEDKDRTGEPDSQELKERRLSQITDQAVTRCREAEGRDTDGNYGEHGLTPAMRRIEARLDHGKLAPDTEKFALKSADRFKAKLAERVHAQPGESANVLAARIHDGIRYTFVYDDEDYTIGAEETEAALGSSGYELITRKPSWDSPDYKGVNSQWLDPHSGLFFEVQFHTHASWDAKQKTHYAYERLADPQTLAEERGRLDAYQREITATVPAPPGALEIPYYHRKGA